MKNAFKVMISILDKYPADRKALESFIEYAKFRIEKLDAVELEKHIYAQLELKEDRIRKAGGKAHAPDDGIIRLRKINGVFTRVGPNEDLTPLNTKEPA
jgi:hypothetical protein